MLTQKPKILVLKGCFIKVIAIFNRFGAEHEFGFKFYFYLIVLSQMKFI